MFINSEQGNWKRGMMQSLECSFTQSHLSFKLRLGAFILQINRMSLQSGPEPLKWLCGAALITSIGAKSTRVETNKEDAYSLNLLVEY